MPPALSNRVNSQLEKIQAMLRESSRVQEAEYKEVKEWRAQDELKREEQEVRWIELSDRLDAIYAKLGGDGNSDTRIDRYTAKEILTVMKEQHQAAIDEVMRWAEALEDVQQKYKDELLSLLSLANTPTTSSASIHSNN
ncbi:hypothetical protein HDZ31DRAFT_38515 [Schizophyllum fasciatum]